MNPDSTCYLYDEKLQDKYAAYLNTQRKIVYIYDDDWKSEHEIKNIHNNKHFKKKICSINRDLRKYCDVLVYRH
jgi:hypothetical protein